MSTYISAALRRLVCDRRISCDRSPFNSIHTTQQIFPPLYRMRSNIPLLSQIPAPSDRNLSPTNSKFA
ncbi:MULTISPECIES: hypothetical protein [Spirulina sp. CCY15215]|uniref:hypothetical protein n=1 Tax=Spirulina sp. CCY15215 TaxID=2767591 RepID=UPI0019508E70|nr:hypothetical protein [Spirulina major]